jgi:hypothetical protein
MNPLLLSVLLACHEPQPPAWLCVDYDESFLFLPPLAEEQDASPAAAIHYSRCESTDFEVPGGE